ncbi:amidase family protein [Flavimarina sp. Hel_I_48]|uniref:amidase family protein n=1 Tax=Flavimarina sp. Hel_I_48 TaxID=1392488 RepID=UPI0004DEF193|nr:amidase family protein [Flavimarina sp. Hel_I_48]
MKKALLLLFILSLSACKDSKTSQNSDKSDKNDTISAIKEREYKVLDSKEIDVDSLWMPFDKALSDFSEVDYKGIKKLVFEKTIPEIQMAINDNQLTYEQLVLFYLYRIKKYDRENSLSLNSVISLNPKVLEEARKLDKNGSKPPEIYSIFGMPVLLKDNINTSEMPTTAGAVAFKDNRTGDSFIAQRLKENGALILGKANLSEWAYFFCGDCPSGYSAVGGQTLNPYGRKIHDTGGSSSGSGVSMAANFAVAAVGTETSGSILSPSSANSVVGLKPTIGLLSRSGIVPISSTLDTPGPMTRTVVDNAIMLDALSGTDSNDPASAKMNAKTTGFSAKIEEIKDFKAFLSSKRLGYYSEYMEQDTLYQQAINSLKDAGATLIALDRPDLDLPEFTRVLNLDMKRDLPDYVANYGGENLRVKDLDEIIAFNKTDSSRMMPYGQKLFYGVIDDEASEEEFSKIKDTLQTRGRQFFDQALEPNTLDAVLSINNYMAGYAAVAKYPALTVPMGYNAENQPMGLTFIAPAGNEGVLLQLGYAYEQLTKERKAPADYE